MLKKIKLTFMFIVVTILFFSTGTAWAANLIGEYDFENNNTDKLGGSTITIHPNTNTHSYGSDAHGDYWQWTAISQPGGGLILDVDGDISQSYSIGVRFSFNQVSGWKKIIDYANQASDNGFYFRNGNLQFYRSAAGGGAITGTTLVGANQVIDLVVTRSADGMFNAYFVIDGVVQTPAEVSGNVGEWAVPYTFDDGGVMKTRFGFFYDDNAVTGEWTNGGKVYAIKGWDAPLAPENIAGAMDAIATTSTITNGAVDPTIIVTGSGFKVGITADDLVVGLGTTGLSVSAVTRVSATQINVGFTGTAAAGDVTIQAKTSAYDPAAGAASNTLTVTVPPPTAISIAAIPGVTAPVNGAAPVTTITETDQYTGTVSWAPVHDPFQASTVYTATITLTPKAGFTLTGVAENFFTVAGTSAPATNAANAGVVTAVFPATASAPSGGGGSSTPPPTPVQEAVIVIVNGEEQNAGIETKTTEDGKSTVTVEVDNKVIESKIDEAIKNNPTGIGNLIQVPVSDKTSDVIKVELTGDIVKKLEGNNFDVSVKRDNIEYIIPAEEFTISKVAENLGILEKDLHEIKVEVKIAKLDEKVVEKYNEVAKANGAELVFPPVEFQIVAKTTKPDGTKADVEISKFSNYVERIMEIPAGIDRSKITTGIVFNTDGTYSHVPTEVFQKDGKWYAKLNSLTNSNYSVVWNPVTVKAVENHWSKDAVNDMASRLVIFNPEFFEPNKAITRADFAEYIVRALGLYRVGSAHENKFKDVSGTGDRTLAILIANEYGIVAGYPDGTFRPNQQITREEAMTMYARAMKVTKLEGVDGDRYQNYTDYNQVGSWAIADVKEVLSARVFNGTTATTISPKSNLTYAEAAQAIKNLLLESKLINK